MKLKVAVIWLQLTALNSLSYGPRSNWRYDIALSAKRLSTEGGLQSYQTNEKEEIDNRPNHIHRAQVIDSHPRKLLEFVCTVFPDVKRTQAKQWLQYDSLLVNDEAQSKFDLPLRVGDWISVRAGKSKGKSRPSGGSSSGERKKTYGTLPSGLKIVYEDEALFVVEKPHGIAVSSSQQSREHRTSASNSTGAVDKLGKRIISKKESVSVSNTNTVHSVVSSFVGKRAGSSESKVFVVNRLDDDVSGLVLFAKSASAKEHLLKNWDTFGIVYNVLCEGIFFPQQGTIKTYMDEGASHVVCSLTKSNGTATKSGSTGGSRVSVPAVSHYRTLESASSSSSMDSLRGWGRGKGRESRDADAVSDVVSYNCIFL
jgi:23S rRNA-/tRNA-specific pseudouridylate synthase